MENRWGTFQIFTSFHHLTDTSRCQKEVKKSFGSQISDLTDDYCV